MSALYLRQMFHYANTLFNCNSRTTSCLQVSGALSIPIPQFSASFAMVARYLSTSTAMATFHWGRASSLMLAMAFQITYGREPNIEIKEERDRQLKLSTIIGEKRVQLVAKGGEVV